MKLNKFTALFRGLAATTATLLAFSAVTYSIAKSPLAIGWMDGWFNEGKSREIWEEVTEVIPGDTSGDSDSAKLIGSYNKKYKSWKEFYEAFKAHGIKQGEEGFALMKNDNEALPLKSGSKVALFGYNAYYLNTAHTGVTGGGNNDDKITLDKGLKSAGITLNDTLTAEDFRGAAGEPDRKGNVSYEGSTKTASANYKIAEIMPDTSRWNIDKNTTTGIVVLGRGGGEGANYMTDDAQNAEDPLALSENEKSLIKYAKEHCSKVVVLVNTANAMELGPISKGGELEVDAIGFCGIPNAYQWQGIANVLAGKANATGAMSDTFVYDNSYNPAVINMGQQQYADTDLITSTPDALGRNNANVRANNYIVEAEGIYVGYKYYETRYYDSIVNASFKANDKIGSRTGDAWDYSKEVLYTFGHGLSYIPYTQTLKEIRVGKSENGEITAIVEVKNEGKQDGYFLAQLYVNKPYTQYDITNKVEKSAIDFLNSGKVFVKAGEKADIEISVPTHYLASWDSNGAGTYILDEGDYWFTAAAGAHEAVNNILVAQGHNTDGTTNGTGVAVTWNLKEFDKTTYATSNGVQVKNQMANADINYYLPGKVTYLTRSDWAGTFPKNYTNRANNSGIQPEAPFKIADATGAKRDEWINELRNTQYVPKTGSQLANVDGTPVAKVADGTFTTAWDWILSLARSNPNAFYDIDSAEWNAIAASLNLSEAVGNILHGGNRTDTLTMGNPESLQSESVAGYSVTVNSDGISINLAIASNTLLGSSFNPALGYEWGLMEGESGLWDMEINKVGARTVWGAGLNQHRHPYNGRNSEYMSEDPMLSNRMGEQQLKGCMEMGAINGPKHMGFNDQELNRQGNACYMTEQKVRETDTRCYEGAMRANEGHGNGVMLSFARIGATNVTNSVGYCKKIIREEWGFTGIITTDMGQNGYHEPYALIMATVNQYAGFGGSDSYVGKNNKGKVTDFDLDDPDTTFNYVTIRAVAQDPVLAEQARQTTKYELYTLAHSASGGYYVAKGKPSPGDITITRRVKTGEVKIVGWEYAFIAAEVVFGICTAVAGLAWIASVVTGKEDN